MVKGKKNESQKAPSADPDSAQLLVSPCDPSNEIAKQILAQCALKHTGSNLEDCNVFLKAVAKEFFGDSIFSGLNANGILAAVKANGSGWTIKTGAGSIDEAIAKAKDGMFVGAGMTSTELGDTNGHLAIVVGCDGQLSGGKIVPIGYAGSISQDHTTRIKGARLSGTFPATKVREEKVTYFFMEPTQTPDLSAFSLLMAASSEPFYETKDGDRISLLREAALVMEKMFDQFKSNNEKKNNAETLYKLASLRVKIGDIELEATFSQEEYSCAKHD